MAVLPLVTMPNPILRKKAVKVANPADKAIQKFIDDMVESMYAHHGVGLAANQVGSPLRICTFYVPEEREKGNGTEPFVVLNIEVTKTEGEREVDEGCLSIPGYRGKLLRAEKVWARGLDRNGKPIKFTGVEGLLAQVIQHETGHLNGQVYTDLLRSAEDLYKFERPAEGEEDDEEEEVMVQGNPEAAEDALPASRRTTRAAPKSATTRTRKAT